jgi:hypothetical protein
MPHLTSTPSTWPHKAQPVPIFSTVMGVRVPWPLFGPHRGRALALEQFLAVVDDGGVEDGGGEDGHGAWFFLK